MMALGLRALKAQLSQQVRRAQAGARVTITDRGKPIAVLAPIEPDDALAWARALVARGQAAWIGGKPAGLRRRIPSRGRPASREVLEDRR
jgi:prevent-host-death family protein